MLFRVMLQIIFCRGWISNENSGANTSYYLYSGAWYHAFSPFDFYLDSHVSVNCVYSDGYVSGYWVNYSSGVRIS